MLVFAAVSVSAAVDKPFTVADEVGLAHFGDPFGGEARAVQFSPDGRYFAALTERGRLDLNRPEDTLRIYRMQDVLGIPQRANGGQSPEPLWAFNRSTDEDGPLVTHWRWLRDSSGIAFLERGARGSTRLMLADLKTRTIEHLTPEDQIVNAFDIRDSTHYVYAVADPSLLSRATAEGQAAAIVGTGRTLLFDLLFPVDQYPNMGTQVFDRNELWAVIAGRRFRVNNQASRESIVLFSEGLSNLALSPDGESLITALAVAEVPSAWEQLYRPPWPAYPYRLHAGRQDLATFMGYRLASRYVQIDLRNGTVRSLSDAPTGATAGWGADASPGWSEHGEAIVLPSAFVASEARDSTRACVAVVSASTGIPSCVEPIEAPNANGSYESSHYVTEVRFADARGHRLVVSHYAGDGLQGTTEYRRTSEGAWTVARRTLGADRATTQELEVSVRQGLNDPPVLMATNPNTKVSRAIWDPNPQLKNFALGEASVYRWKDKSGRDWKGGLFKPTFYDPGRRYPLVIQTHGFMESEFRPSGLFPTAFAARALAGAGVVVLQAQDCPVEGTPEEAPCNVGGYEAAVAKLVKEGLVDSERIGIIGFSRSCLYVMETLTTSTLHVKAASITDGVMGNYLQQMIMVDEPGFSEVADATIGAQAFGMGLQLWLKRSPLFNMDKVSAALQVVAEGRPDLAFMWEPYAAMRYLHKPVDLILLNNNEHILSNPAARLASQGGTVDWMRFWLQDYEDPAPAKTEQYRRWRELRRIQQAGQ
jgi:dipeptidyl aminopeptidase/acylaminoacyl peptidase